MGDRGSFILSLLNARGNPWRGDTRVRIKDDRDRTIFEKRKQYQGPIRFTNLRAAPKGRHWVHVKTQIHVPASSYVNVSSLTEKNLELRLPIHYEEADQHGSSIPFPKFGELEASGLAHISAVLGRDLNPEIAQSNECTVRKGSGPAYYDGLVAQKDREDNHRRIACFFNLYTKMKNTQLAAGCDAWCFVHSIMCLEQDRFFAQVDPNLNMNEYLDKLDQSQSFESYDSNTHDINPPSGFTKHTSTYKSKDDFGNLQMTFSSKQSGDKKIWVVDADIDEKTGLTHIFEVFLHWITGAKTNPYAVHQLLCLQGFPPSYRLRTRLNAD